jgi:RNA polymerase sigma factor (TIGR02999 family)
LGIALFSVQSHDRDAGEVTQLLARWSAGDRAALDLLTSVVYAELRKIADGYLRRERRDHTLQPTALVHEAWMRLIKQHETSFDSRRQFFALAAQVMRQILVDHARAAQAAKRGGGDRKVAIEEAENALTGGVNEFLALDHALTQLAAVSARKARIIEMKYFAGLNGEEIAAVLGISPPTVCRELKTAEAWLSETIAAES